MVPRGEQMKKCPYCAEKVQKDALICKSCGRSLVQTNSGESAGQSQNQQPVLQIVQQTKKSHTGCWVGLAVLVFLIIMSLIFLKACSTVFEPKQAVLVDPVSATIEASVQQTDIANGTQTFSTQSTPEASKTFKVGDTFSVDDLQLTVNNVADIEPTEFTKPMDGNKFIVVSITFENNGTSDKLVNSGDFKVLGPDGTQYSQSIEASFASNLESKFESLMPGAKVTGSAFFEIPKDQKGFKMYFKPSFSFDNTIVEIDLGI